MKYKKGKWRIEILDKELVKEHPLYVVAEEATGGIEGIALIINHPYKPRVVANAQLIAAAPDLYEACKVGATRIHNHIRYEHGDYRTMLQRDLKQLLAAIAKAEGK